MKRLKEITDVPQFIKFYQSYAVAWLPDDNEDRTKINCDVAIEKLSEALKLLMEITEELKEVPNQKKMVETNYLDDFFKIVNEEDFIDVKMWLSYMLSELIRKSK